MPYYLLQVAYTDKGWNALIRNPQNRGEATRPTIENLGGRVINSFVSLGEYDVAAIFEMPNNLNAEAFSMVIMAAGAVKSVKITPLLTWEEGIEAMKKAHSALYHPPE